MTSETCMTKKELIGRPDDKEMGVTNGQVCGVVPHLVDGGLSILQYADDTVLFFDHDLEQAKNMKMILCMFEELSGLKINFHKGEIFCFGQARECESLKSNLFGCKVGEYPFRYLGLPMHFRKLNNKDWKSIEDRYLGLPMHFRKLNNKDWKSIEDRIENKLSNWKGKMLSYGGRLFVYVFFEVPRGILRKIDYFRSRFFWQNDSHKKKYRLLCNEEGMCQELIKNKYLKEKPLAQVENKLGDSYFWRSLIKVKDLFLNSGRFKLVSSNQLRRALVGNNLHEWHNLVANLMFVNLEEGNDTFVWGLHKSGSFSVKSMYNSLINNVSQEIWHLKIPLKIKIFLWFLKRRGGQNKVDMLLAGAAALCWALWLTRNDILFNNCKPTYVLHALFRGPHWLCLWAQLQRIADKKEVVEAYKILESSAMELFSSFGWPFGKTQTHVGHGNVRRWEKTKYDDDHIPSSKLECINLRHTHTWRDFMGQARVDS
ncbi:LOW QUALITY PROTEIN: hypothetical protein U9M48_001505 [Paspalum notatum var. saurae]|uniref:Reverse transcriptase domain-containing protein n=1 Tax=Paspalum notatum var. saurae TaxID=547442 RepID=A0AAQ3PIF5_PASNO